MTRRDASHRGFLRETAEASRASGPVCSKVNAVSVQMIDRQRLLRRRREHSRQIIIFGLIGTLLASVFVVALLIFGGVITAPFERAFSTPRDAVAEIVPPCLPTVAGQTEGPLPVPYSEIELRIFNASGIGGVATANQTVLGRRGFVINTLGDWGSVLPVNQLHFGLEGIVQAYTVAAQFPQIQMVLDTRPDSSVDLVVGENYDEPLPTDQVPLAADRPLLNIRGCRPSYELTPTPAPAFDLPS